MPADQHVECRGPISLAAIGFSLACFGLVMALGGFGPASPPLTPPACVAIAALFLAIASGCFYVSSQARLIGTAEGLRWRTGTGEWRSVPWSGVTDYYLTPYHQNSLRIVETTAGRLQPGVNDWTNLPRLQQLIVLHAAIPGVEDWSMLGSRERDRETEYVFRYTERSAWEVVLPCICGAAAWTWMGIALAQRVGTDIAPGVALTNPRLAELTLLSLLLMLLLLGGGVMLCLRILADWWSHRREVVRASKEALEWESPRGGVRIAWSDVAAFGIARKGWPIQEAYVRGRRGEQISFAPYIGRRVILQACIQARATAAERSQWPNDRSSEALGGEALCWRDGARVYHFRTRLNRAMLWLSGFMVAAIWSLPILPAIIDQPAAATPPLLQTPAGLALLVSIGFLWQLLCYYLSAVLVDEQGITQVGVFGRKRLAWSDVQRYGVRGSTEDAALFVSGEHDAIRISGLIARRDDLMREIAARASSAEGAWPSSGESGVVSTETSL